MDKTLRQVKYQKGKQEKMTETHEKLLLLLLSRGQDFVAGVCECGASEANRKISGETGFKLRQLSDLFDELGVCLAGCDDVVISKDEHASLVFMAKLQLDNKYGTIQKQERRGDLSLVNSGSVDS